MLRLAIGVFPLIWIATPCKTFSVLWLEEDKPALRSPHYPHEWFRAPKRWQAYVQKHNELASLSTRLEREAFQAGGTFVIENPVDRGDRSSTFFEKKVCKSRFSMSNAEVRTLAGKTNEPPLDSRADVRLHQQLPEMDDLDGCGPAVE